MAIVRSQVVAGGGWGCFMVSFLRVVSENRLSDVKLIRCQWTNVFLDSGDIS